MDLLLARHPDRLHAEHSIIEEEMIALDLEGKSAAVTAMIGMLGELHRDGRRCRFIKALKVYIAYQTGVRVFERAQEEDS